LDPDDPDSPVAQNKAGEGLWKEGRAAEAKDAFDKARLRLENLAAHFPDVPDYRQELVHTEFRLSRLHCGLQQYDKALADYSETIALDPKNAAARYNRGLAYLELHQYEKALADLNKAIELDPKNAGFCNNLAWLFATWPDPKFWDSEKAVRFAQKAVELAPTQASCWNTLGAAHYRAGDWKAAVEALSKSDELLKGNMLSFNAFFLAMAHWRLGAKDKARQWLENGVRWMEKNLPDDEELRRFRSEAEELLGVKDSKN
jgi:tetratricopeptide (TPR) repeat protein